MPIDTYKLLRYTGGMPVYIADKKLERGLAEMGLAQRVPVSKRAMTLSILRRAVAAFSRRSDLPVPRKRRNGSSAGTRACSSAEG